MCWLYNGPGPPPLTRLTGAPVRILVGANEHYEGGPQSCPDMLQLAVEKGIVDPTLTDLASPT